MHNAATKNCLKHAIKQNNKGKKRVKEEDTPSYYANKALDLLH